MSASGIIDVTRLKGGKLKFKKPPKKKLKFKSAEIKDLEKEVDDTATEYTEINQQPNDDESTFEPITTTPEPIAEQPARPIKMKKPLKFKNKRQPIQFDNQGIPFATRENLDRMTVEDIEKFFPQWTLEKYLNPLIVELADFVSVKMSATKSEKLKAILKYKKEFPSGAKATKSISFENAYESFNWRKNTVVKFRGQEWTLPNSTQFKSEIMTRYNFYRLSDKDIKLNRVDQNNPRGIMKYQQFVGEQIDPKNPWRGMLAFHGLGSGKTRTSVEGSTRFINDGMKVLVLLPGALRSNFMVELFNYGSQKHGIGIPNYQSLPDVERLAKEKAATRVIANYYDILTYNEKGLYDKLKALANPETGYLENRLIIVDEIHNLVSRMSKATNLSRQVYYFLMDRTHNCKMLFLSGTPLLNNAYELGVLFNLVRGKIRTGGGNFPLFPENEEDFNEKFVNIYDKTVINQQLFKKRISGLVSYYAGSTDRKGMPEEIEHPIEKLEMSDHQFQLYLLERMAESKKESKKSRQMKNNTSENTGSAFRTYSRMVCNFAFPQGIIRPKPVGARDIKTFQKYAQKQLDLSQLDVEDIQDELDPSAIEGFKTPTAEKMEEEDVLSGRERILTKKQRQETYAKQLGEALIELESMKDEVFSQENLSQFSPKMLKIYQNMTQGPGAKGLVYIYTEFRILEGVRIMGSVLQYNGYQKINFANVTNFAAFKKIYGEGLRYGIISSDEDSKQRKLLLEIFNHPENKYGAYLKCILGTSASSEGINLKRVRQIHIMEPYWNMVRNNQVKGRGVRFGSHNDMPEDEKNVHIFSYHVTLTNSQQAEIVELLDNPKDRLSTDEYIHQLARRKDVINSQFLKMIKEAAVDCGLNYLVNVKVDPDLQCLDIPKDIGKYLYLPDINDDPEDTEFLKNIKYEDFIVAQIKFDKVYGYKAHPNGRPIMDPPSINHNGQTYHQILTLYDYELLNSGIEVKEKYYIVGTNIIINA